MTTQTDTEAKAAEETEQDAKGLPLGDAIATLVIFTIVAAAILVLLERFFK